jgi:hypothetical protein
MLKEYLTYSDILFVIDHAIFYPIMVLYLARHHSLYPDPDERYVKPTSVMSWDAHRILFLLISSTFMAIDYSEGWITWKSLLSPLFGIYIAHRWWRHAKIRKTRLWKRHIKAVDEERLGSYRASQLEAILSKKTMLSPLVTTGRERHYVGKLVVPLNKPSPDFIRGGHCPKHNRWTRKLWLNIKTPLKKFARKNKKT